ncbi:trypsin-like peptidase domain-containing protein [Streptomyces sp. NPDC058954]|uniref:serine protease n=1 Tax=Streptomyces sp. NPDC058954 TaxID=3346677 RepID=UPI0036A1EE6F
MFADPLDERDLKRLALVCAGTLEESTARGSGWLIGRQLVLTAHHVVVDEHHEPLPTIKVRVGDPRSAAGSPKLVWRDAQLCWPGPGTGSAAADVSDVALLRLDKPVDVESSPSVRWGRAAGITPVPYHGFGFPLFAEPRPDDPARVRRGTWSRAAEHLRGELPPVSTDGLDGLVLDTNPWPAEMADPRRRWSGASGTAVFCHGRLVGVVTLDMRGGRRLYAFPTRLLLGDPAFARLVAEDTGEVPILETVRGNELGLGRQAPAFPPPGSLPSNVAESLSRVRLAMTKDISARITAQDLAMPEPLTVRWRERTDLFLDRADSHTCATGSLTGELKASSERDLGAAWLAGVLLAGGPRHLVVLGEAGTGKTTLAILLARALLDESDAVPVVLPMASWDPGDLDEPLSPGENGPADDSHRRGTRAHAGEVFATWFARRIAEVFPSARALCDPADLVHSHRLVAVLDGLDEMPRRLRAAAIARLDKYDGMLVLTSRSAEFAEASARGGVLSRARGIEIKPVKPADAVRYLTGRDLIRRREDRWKEIEDTVTSRTGPVADVLSTPLMLSLARKAYEHEGSSPSELAIAGDRAVIKKILLNRYLTSVYPNPTERRRTARWLTFLAREMGRSQGRDPDFHWWRLARAVPWPVIVLLYTLSAAMLGAAVGWFGEAINDEPESAVLVLFSGGLAGGFVGSLSGMIAGRTVHATGPPPPRPGIGATALSSLRHALSATTVTCLLGTVLLLGLHAGVPAEAGVIDRALTEWWVYLLANQSGEVASLASYIVLCLGVAVVATLLDTAHYGFPRHSAPRLASLLPALIGALRIGALVDIPIVAAVAMGGIDPEDAFLPCLMLASIVTVALGLGRWLAKPITSVEERSPVAILRTDRKATMITAGVSGAVATLVIAGLKMGTGSWLSTAASTGFEMGAGLALTVAYGSGSAWITFVLARIWLTVRRQVPPRLFRALHKAQEVGVLRPAGAAYQFRHDEFRDHLSRTSEPHR